MSLSSIIKCTFSPHVFAFRSFASHRRKHCRLRLRFEWEKRWRVLSKKSINMLPSRHPASSHEDSHTAILLHWFYCGAPVVALVTAKLSSLKTRRRSGAKDLVKTYLRSILWGIKIRNGFIKMLEYLVQVDEARLKHDENFNSLSSSLCSTCSSRRRCVMWRIYLKKNPTDEASSFQFAASTRLPHQSNTKIFCLHAFFSLSVSGLL